MSFITLLNGRSIGDYLNPYIVAELNTSHFGDIEIAKKMIDQAKVAGCDCVKFQSWSTETLYSESYYKANKIAKRMVTKFSLNNSQLKELSNYCFERSIDFASTPYSIEEANFLIEECNVPFIKIASMELNNLQYLIELGYLGVPLVLSTGMGTFEEISNAVKAIQDTKNEQLIILHCTSVYPAKPEIIHLNNIISLRRKFSNYPIGYSDHSVGIEVPVASIALGACLIEKHFTLDNSRIGMDNQMAMEPEEMATMVAACHKVHQSMGRFERILCNDELDQIPKMRRSIVTRKDLNPGDVITIENVELKRPGTGIPPTEFYAIVGRQVNKVLEKGSIILPSDLI